MRLALLTALLVLSVGVVAAPADAKPPSYCETTGERTGAYCHVQLWPDCYTEHYVTLEDGHTQQGYCAP